jgi:hypothetical protein
MSALDGAPCDAAACVSNGSSSASRVTPSLARGNPLSAPAVRTCCPSVRAVTCAAHGWPAAVWDVVSVLLEGGAYNRFASATSVAVRCFCRCVFRLLPYTIRWCGIKPCVGNQHQSAPAFCTACIITASIAVHGRCNCTLPCQGYWETGAAVSSCGGDPS